MLAGVEMEPGGAFDWCQNQLPWMDDLQ